jgi:hypothetical protein
MRRRNRHYRISIFALALSLAGLLPAAADAADALYEALLNAKLQTLPAGFSAVQVMPGPVDEDDQNAGLMGNVEIRLQGPDPKARINYLLFPDEAAANAYLTQFDAALTAHKVNRTSLTNPPQARCGETQENAGCAIGAGRVAVFALGTRVDSSVGPLLKSAFNHLNEVERASGLQ